MGRSAGINGENTRVATTENLGRLLGHFVLLNRTLGKGDRSLAGDKQLAGVAEEHREKAAAVEQVLSRRLRDDKAASDVEELLLARLVDDLTKTLAATATFKGGAPHITVVGDRLTVTYLNATASTLRMSHIKPLALLGVNHIVVSDGNTSHDRDELAGQALETRGLSDKTPEEWEAQWWKLMAETYGQEAVDHVKRVHAGEVSILDPAPRGFAKMRKELYSHEVYKAQKSAAGKALRALRKTHEGRPAVYHTCPHCRLPFRAKEIRPHSAKCEKNPRMSNRRRITERQIAAIARESKALAPNGYGAQLAVMPDGHTSLQPSRQSLVCFEDRSTGERTNPLCWISCPCTRKEVEEIVRYAEAEQESFRVVVAQ